jgi:DNA-binding MarR family transcriptional regulator
MTRDDDAAAGVTDVLDSVRRIVRTLRLASRAAEKQVGLSGAQVFVLHALARGPVLSLNELAERTRTHQSSVSVVVQRLVERGLVERTPVPGDARRTALSLTAAARRKVKNAPDAPTEVLIAALERMPAGQRTRLAEGLRRLVQALGAADEPPTMFFEDDATAARARGKAGRKRGSSAPQPGRARRDASAPNPQGGA